LLLRRPRNNHQPWNKSGHAAGRHRQYREIMKKTALFPFPADSRQDLPPAAERTSSSVPQLTAGNSGYSRISSLSLGGSAADSSRLSVAPDYSRLILTNPDQSRARNIFFWSSPAFAKMKIHRTPKSPDATSSVPGASVLHLSTPISGYSRIRSKSVIPRTSSPRGGSANSPARLPAGGRRPRRCCRSV